MDQVGIAIESFCVISMHLIALNFVAFFQSDSKRFKMYIVTIQVLFSCIPSGITGKRRRGSHAAISVQLQERPLAIDRQVRTWA